MIEGSYERRARFVKLLSTFLWGSCAFVLILFVLSYGILAIFHLRYPFELEWIEGAMLDHVVRILDGKHLYVRPSFSFTSLIYAPLYYYVSAGVALIVGKGFLALRLVSVVASGGVLVLLYLLAFQETKRRYFSLLAPALFLACYEISGAWLDLGRVDTLLLFFIIYSLYWLRQTISVKTIFFASICAVLAFFTKQLVWVIYLPIAFYLGWYHRKYLLLFVGMGILLTIPTYVYLNTFFDGWLQYYLFALPSQHRIEPKMILEFWTRDLLAIFGIGMFMALSYFLPRFKRYASTQTRFFYGALLVGALGMGWLGRLHSGGYLNVLLPTYLMLSLIAAITVSYWDDFLRNHAGSTGGILLPALLLLQLIFLEYDPRAYLLSEDIQKAQREVTTYLEKVDGPVLIVNHGGYLLEADVPKFAHAMALTDIARSSDAVAQAHITNEFRKLLQEQHFAAIILDDTYTWRQAEIEFYYERTDTFPKTGSFEMTDVMMRPQFVYTPRAWPKRKSLPSV